MKSLNILLIGLMSMLFVITTNAAAQSQTTSNSSSIIYTVQRGDNLSTIALQYGSSVGEILDWNKDQISNRDLIYKGQQLIVGYEVAEEIEEPLDETKTDSDSSDIVSQQSQNHAKETTVDKPAFDWQAFLDMLTALNVPLQDLQNGLDKAKKNNQLSEYDEDQVLMAKLKIVTIKYNTRSKKLFSYDDIVKSVKGKLSYYDDAEGFVLIGKKIRLNRHDYDKLIWFCCHGYNKRLYYGQSLRKLLLAEQFGIRYNTPDDTVKYDYFDIYNSMIDKPYVYSQAWRCKVKNGKMSFDCSSCVVFFCNCYGAKVPDQASSGLLARYKADVYTVNSKDEIKAGDLFGVPGDHVMLYIGDDYVVNFSGDGLTLKKLSTMKKSKIQCRYTPEVVHYDLAKA